jgi:hypothetical protein
MRYITLALTTTAAALAVAACGSSGSPAPAASKGSSNTTSSASSSAGPTPQAQNGRDRVGGLIASVSGNTVQVNRRDGGSATVDVTPSTAVAQVSPAQLADLTSGSCVTVRPTRDNGSGGAQITARRVMIGSSSNGQCAAPENARGRAVRGTVASVNGNTLVLNVSGQNGSTSQTNVAVDNNTTYTKRATATSAAITQGECLAARGAKDSNGALQATNVTVTPANNGTCPGGRR